MKRARGFTLIELIIVLVIGGILVSIAVPNLSVFLKNSARTTRINELVTAFNYARSEAVKRNTDIRVCSSTDASTCSGSTSFSSGWLVQQVAPSSVLRVFEQDLGGTTTIIGSVSSFTYQGNGFPASGSGSATFTHCDDRGAKAARAVIISSTGHPRISRDSDGDGIHESATGADLTCP